MTQDAEILEIKAEIKRLQEQLDKKCPKGTLAQLCTKVPYMAIRTKENGEPFFSSMRTDAWTAMVNAAKCLFLKEQELEGGGGCITGHPKKISDMTQEQQHIAARFLDEIVEIFNRYFVENNKDILWNGKPYEVKESEE